MIRNVSTRNRDIENEIADLVGKSYSLFERFRMGGNGSPRLTIIDASEQIKELLLKDSYINYCNIEMRPRGIVVGFRSRLETYVWCIPYNKLSVFKNKHSFTIYAEKEKMVIQNKNKSGAAFFRKLLNQKSKFVKTEQYVDYL
jgi:hypothetical protein